MKQYTNGMKQNRLFIFLPSGNEKNEMTDEKTCMVLKNIYVSIFFFANRKKTSDSYSRFL